MLYFILLLNSWNDFFLSYIFQFSISIFFNSPYGSAEIPCFINIVYRLY